MMKSIGIFTLNCTPLTKKSCKSQKNRFGKQTIAKLTIVLLTLSQSAFETRQSTYYWLIYDGIGPEKELSSYSMAYMEPLHIFQPLGHPTLNWFRVIDFDDDHSISAWEFEYAFEYYDVINTLNDLLSDEFSDLTGELDLRNRP